MHSDRFAAGDCLDSEPGGTSMVRHSHCLHAVRVDALFTGSARSGFITLPHGQLLSWCQPLPLPSIQQQIVCNGPAKQPSCDRHVPVSILLSGAALRIMGVIRVSCHHAGKAGDRSSRVGWITTGSPGTVCAGATGPQHLPFVRPGDTSNTGWVSRRSSRSAAARSSYASFSYSLAFRNLAAPSLLF